MLTVADKIGAHICGCIVTSKDGSPMKMESVPSLAHGKAPRVGDPVAVVIAETYMPDCDAAETKVRVPPALPGRQ